MPTTLRIKITAKRQITFPAAPLKALRVKPGDYLALIQEKDDWRLAPVGSISASSGPSRPRFPRSFRRLIWPRGAAARKILPASGIDPSVVVRALPGLPAATYQTTVRRPAALRAA